MQYGYYDFGVEYAPVVGVMPQNSNNFLPNKAFTGFNNFGQPTKFDDNTFAYKNPLLYNNTTFSRQSTAANTPMATQHFVSRFVPLPGTQGPNLFRKRNSTNASRGKRRNSSFMRNGTNNTNYSRVFVPKVYTTDVYPSRFPFHEQNSAKATRGMSSIPFSADSENLSSMNSAEREETEWVKHYSDRSRTKMRRRRSKRNPNFTKTSAIERAFNSLKDLEFPKLDAKDAVSFLEGLFLAAFNILKNIVGELRADLITGMFLGEDGDYDAARSYYYTNLKQKIPNSGLTQRIDYTEAIENEYRNRREMQEESVRPEDVPEYIAMGKKDFMNMDEKEFEEYLMGESYPEAPLSVPRL